VFFKSHIHVFRIERSERRDGKTERKKKALMGLNRRWKERGIKEKEEGRSPVSPPNESITGTGEVEERLGSESSTIRGDVL
jgi:hypothetical protein